METRLSYAFVRPNLANCLRGLALLSFILTNLVTLSAQETGGMGVESPSQYEFMAGSRQMVAITVGVRDARGLPLDDKATVRLISKASVYNRTIPTEVNSSATFPNVWEGPYDVEVKCEGYRPVLAHIDVSGGLAFFSTYIYLHPVNETVPSGGPAKGLVLTPKLATEIDKGLGSMHKQQYEAAKAHFVKAEKMVPSSSDVAYLIGTVELAMKQNEAARANFQKAVTLDPANDRAMVALGELQLQTGDPASAIVTLNQAYAANGAGWRTRYLLASAYAKTGKLRDAEMQAASAVKLARTNSATPLLLLGDIQAASGKWVEAKQSWNQILTECPNCPEANDARKRTAEASESHGGASNSHAGEFSHLAVAPELPPTIDDRPWAPPDVDSKEYSVATDVSCSSEDVIPRAMRRTKVQLGNLEKFGATEHIEHEEIDKSGVPGPLKIHNFYYLVFVFPYKSDSVFLEESRDGGNGVADFPTSLATIGLNSLGINVLQPAYRDGYNYQCEGLATIRGQGAWQIRFEEKKNANLDVRRWQRSGTTYNIPLKGRIWLSSTTYDLLRIETDLREPVVNLELTRDHLLVDYGPVSFTAGNTTMWLPWSAEMYLELHGKRYHHKHLLSNYMLFGVDTSHKINRPKNAPPEDSSPDTPSPGTTQQPEAPKPK